MDKNIIKNRLIARFITEAESTPGIKMSKSISKKDSKINKDGVSAVEKDVKAYDKDLKKSVVKADVKIKFNYTNDAEKTYHQEIEIMNGQEMIQYDRTPDEIFKARAREAIAGSSRMGNEGGIANAQAVWGASSDTFGEDLIKSIEDSQKRRADADRAYLSLGDDIELLPKNEKSKGRNYALKEGFELGAGYTHFAILKANGKIATGWNYSSLYDKDEKAYDNYSIQVYVREDIMNDFPENKLSDFKLVTRKYLDKKNVNPSDTNNWFKTLSENNKISKLNKINEGMKRLRFNKNGDKPFDGVNTTQKLGHALTLIPESYKLDKKEFEMTDGNLTCKIRWEGTVTEGTAIVLAATNKSLVNEDMDKMKHLMGYKSQETLGLLKGKSRINENEAFANIWNKSKVLLGESEDIEGQKGKDGSAESLDGAVKVAPEAKCDIEGSVAAGAKTNAPAAKTGSAESLDDVVSVASEATTDIEGSVADDAKTNAPKPKEGHWDKINVGQASEAKKDVTMNENTNLVDGEFYSLD